MSVAAAEWRDDLDALQFAVAGHQAVCLVHRLAFRTFVGSSAARDTCCGFYAAHAQAFLAAALAKIDRQSITPGQNLHLNSRDIRRAMVSEPGGARGRGCSVLTR